MNKMHSNNFPLCRPHGTRASTITCSVMRGLALSKPNDMPKQKKPLQESKQESWSWRLYGINVPITQDPGKDDYSVHPQLLSVISKKLRLDSVPAESVKLLRKSFDARSKRKDGRPCPKSFEYTVEVSESVLAKAVLKKLVHKPGSIERVCTSSDQVQPESGKSSTAMATPLNVTSALMRPTSSQDAGDASAHPQGLKANSCAVSDLNGRTSGATGDVINFKAALVNSSDREVRSQQAIATALTKVLAAPFGSDESSRHHHHSVLSLNPSMTSDVKTSSSLQGIFSSNGRASGDEEPSARFLHQRPVVVVGSGPAGLFAALSVASRGLKVILLERGQPVEQRGRDIGALFVRRHLDPDSNLCYGEGGAGTWSDGKLTTRIGRNSDPVRRVLQTLVDCGAPESILVSGKPHLGTERLVRLLKTFRSNLQALGVDVRFGTTVKDLMVQGSQCNGVVLDSGEEISSSAVVLAVGHSARSLYKMLHQRGVAITAKSFAMGFRIEHPQSLIDTIRYGAEDAAGVMRGKGKLPVADYSLTAQIMGHLPAGEEAVQKLLQSLPAEAGRAIDYHQTESVSKQDSSTAFNSNTTQQQVPVSMVSLRRDIRSSAGTSASGGLRESISPAAGTKEQEKASGARLTAGPSAASFTERGVYSFCMCPGGQIVPTSTNELELCINGMSFSRRNSLWANSALVVTVQPHDWEHLEQEHGPLAGMELQVHYERIGAAMGGGGFVAPVQRVTDFVEGIESKGELPSSSYRLGVKAGPLHQLYDPKLTHALQGALKTFERRLPGFSSSPHGLLHGVETRTSAPVRIERSPDDAASSCESVSLAGLYPCGEGAGYAGGIVSAAVDGLKVGEAVVVRVLHLNPTYAHPFPISAPNLSQ
ncbi:hypothetical protein CEUSTIGMA_g4712.t1 [Chlamydomonas eustigma]|uniref:Uncharacterized protein n=1 Tax=Chlamydomonas eustigma TaxID=1157962 RepID=A0A250X2I6_9CHLO|nr:hypothetical protein CEUSTIGMA_g4712.t1 [Chlamydomonas eustigma]|eukprot:GAX77266.1 hypothetical protein CEUSTIGMA_g4712.t1 [Chlamydomonas eustigma]